MASNEIRADYTTLEDIAQRFALQADVNDEMQQLLRQRMGILQSEGWKGEGADAFFAEMENDIFPALKRLREALDETDYTVKKIVDLLLQAEQDASAQFSTRS